MSDQPAPDAPPSDAPKPDAPPTKEQSIKLPDDHPLVTTLATQKEQIRDLKSKLETAGNASKTTEQRLAELEERAVKAERAALVKSAQVKHSISDEDAALFLTGDTADALEAQAKRLADRDAAAKKGGNHVPNEGKTPSASKSTSSWASVLNEFDRQRQT